MNLFDFEAGREGYYGQYGGAFVPEIITSTIKELRDCFRQCQQDSSFWMDGKADEYYSLYFFPFLTS